MNQQWKTIDSAPEFRNKYNEIQYVLLIGRYPGSHIWTDIVYTWRNNDGSWARWGHVIPPTHWMFAPNPPEEY